MPKQAIHVYLLDDKLSNSIRYVAMSWQLHQQISLFLNFGRLKYCDYSTLVFKGYVKGKSPFSLIGCIKLMTQDLVTQSENNIVMAAAVLTHRIKFSKRLNSLIRSQRSLI